MWRYNHTGFLSVSSYFNYGTYLVSLLIKRDSIVWTEWGLTFFSTLDSQYHGVSGEKAYFCCCNRFDITLVDQYRGFLHSTVRFNDINQSLRDCLSDWRDRVQACRRQIKDRVRYLVYVGLSDPALYALKSSVDGIGRIISVRSDELEGYCFDNPGNATQYWAGENELPSGLEHLK